MDGVLELVADLNADGATYLSHRYATPPFCISKPYDHGSHLQVQLQQVGPGLLGGDQAGVKVEVRGGSLMLTSPSALRILPRGGVPSRLTQRMRVGPGCCLEVWPEPVFPHQGGQCRQVNELEVEEGASLFWFEGLAPGRDASGERHAWDHLDLETFLKVGGKLLLWERLRGTGGEWAAAASAFKTILPWTGIFYASTPGPDFGAFLRRALEEKPPAEVQWGISLPEPGLAAVKMMAGDGQGIRNMRLALMAAVREFCLRHA